MEELKFEELELCPEILKAKSGKLKTRLSSNRG